MVKRGMDVIVGSTLLAFLAPVFLLVAIAVRIEDGKAVLFAHRRVGRGGVTFNCLKFRTMRTDGDRVLADLLERDHAAAAEWRATQKLRDDPRVTRCGRILRSTSLDELPQLINVVRGDMSLVGPRPVVEEELHNFYAPLGGLALYLAMRPGVTGPWQISGRSTVSYAARVQLDSAYVRSPSLRRDVAVLLRTVLVVIGRRGAY